MSVAMQSSDLEWRIPKMTVARRMKWAREDAGISGEQMAELMCVSAGTISNWESGKQPRNLFDVIERWAKFTRAPADWLLTGHDPAANTTWLSRPSLRLVELPDGEQMELFPPQPHVRPVPFMTPVTPPQ